MTPPSNNKTGPSLADELNARIDCEDLALRLNFERPGDRGNFKNPQTAKSHSATLSVFRGDDGRSRFFDHRTGDKGGAIDLYMLGRGCDAATAIRELSDMYGIKVAPPPAAKTGERPERSLPEWIADKCLAAARESGQRDRDRKSVV